MRRKAPPTLATCSLGDTTAAVYATIGLYKRDAKKSGRGQSVDVSLLESLYAVLTSHVMAYDQLGLPGKRTGNRTSSSAPRNTYRTKDDRWIAIAGSTQAISERLFKEMGRPDLISDPRFKTNRDRVANGEELDKIVSAWVLERTQAEIIEQLIRAEVAVAPVCDFKDLAEDPQLIARKALVTIEDPELGTLRMPDVQPRLSETPGRIRHAGLPMGVYNKEIYQGRVGLTEAEMKKLQAEGVI